MSLSSIAQSAFGQAQSVLAQMQGMSAGGSNTLMNGAAYTLVYGAAQVVDVLNPGGGYKRRTELKATMTRVQLSAAPAPKTTLTRTDITPQITYRIDVVDTNDPLHYVLVLEKIG